MGTREELAVTDKNVSPLKTFCGGRRHVPTLWWNNTPWGATLRPNPFVTLSARMLHHSPDTCAVPRGPLSRTAAFVRLLGRSHKLRRGERPGGGEGPGDTSG